MRPPAARRPWLLLALAGLGLAWWLATPADPRPGPAPAGVADDAPGASTPPPPDPGAPGPTPGPGGAGPPPARPVASAPAGFTGLVLDAAGYPLPGAEVTLARADPRGARGAPFPDLEVLARTRAAADGGFAVPALGGGPWRLSAAAPGYALAERLLAAPGAHLRLVLGPEARLRLTVLGAAGTPLPEATIQVAGEGAPRRLAAQPDGALLLQGLRPGAVRLAVRAEGHAPATAGPFVLRAQEETEGAAWLRRLVEVAGRVLDEAGDPVAGARVRIARPGASSDPAPTAADGRFGPLAAGAAGERVQLSVEHAEYAPALVPQEVPDLAGVHEVEVVLRRAPRVAGRVRDAAGGPVAGARVAWTFDGVAGREPATSVSDAEGRFEVPPPPVPAPGRQVFLYARHGGALAVADPRTLVPGTPVELTLRGGHAVRGLLRGPAGLPLARLPVTLALERGGGDASGAEPQDLRRALLNELGFPGLATTTATDGAFDFADVPPGSYRLRVLGDAGWQPVGAAFGVTGPLDLGPLTVGGGLALQGVLRGPDGAPLGGGTIVLRPADDAGGIRRAETAPDGGYRLTGLAPGSYALEALWPPYAPARRTLDLSADEHLDVALEAAARLEVRIAGQEPYAGWVEVALGRGAGRAAHRRVLGVADGGFRWDDAPPGEWRVTLRTPDGRVARAPDTLLLEAGRRTSVSLVLEAAAALEGRVRTAAKDPVPGATVTLRGADGETRSAHADAHGAYAFEGLAPGAWTLRAYGPGGAPRHRALDLGPAQRGTLDVELAPAGGLDVRVVDAAGRPLRGVRLAFRDADGPIPPFVPLRTDAAGRARREGLPAGPVTVEALGPGHPAAPGVAAEVRAGEVRPLELVLR